jgi:hypothetical protein
LVARRTVFRNVSRVVRPASISIIRNIKDYPRNGEMRFSSTIPEK